GIGRAIALELGRQGATVVGTATSAAGADAITAALAQEGISGCGEVLDVDQAQACSDLVDAVGKRFAPITILVNNAGITRDNLAMRMKDEEWQAVIETDLSAVFRLCRLVLRPMMKARAGRIVNITSVV